MRAGQKPLKWQVFRRVVALCLLSLMVAPADRAAADDDEDESLSSFASAESQRCFQRFQKNFSDLTVENTKLGDIDPEHLCETNRLHDRPVQHNRIANPSELPTLKKGESRERKIPENFGYCEASIFATREAYRYVEENRKRACVRMHKNLDQYSSCIKNGQAKECQEKFEAIVGIWTDEAEKLRRASYEGINFVKDFPKQNEQVKKLYVNDRKTLEQANLDTSTPEEQRALHVAEDNGGGSSRVEYFERLRNSGVSRDGKVIEGPLLLEQTRAANLSKKFSDKLVAYFNAETSEYQGKVTAFKGRIKAPDNTTLGDWTNRAGSGLGAAAPLLQQSAAPASALSGAASAALPLAAAGAAGAALSSSGYGGGSASTLGDGATAPVIEGVGGTDLAGNAANESPVASAPGALPPAPGSPADKLAVKPADPADATATFTGNGSGASAMPGKNKGDAKRSPASAMVANAGGEETLKPFGGDLKAPPLGGKKFDGGGEVSALLGQMKNLFNFDESMGGMPAPFVDQTPTRPEGGTEYPYEATNSEEYPGDGAGPADESTQASAAIGGKEISLFTRVHSRHRKCMEKGLVIFGLNKLPEEEEN